MIGLLLYCAAILTLGVVQGWRRERLQREQNAILSSLKQGQARIGESLAEVETAAAIHTASRPAGGVEETLRRRALRASQTNEG